MTWVVADEVELLLALRLIERADARESRLAVIGERALDATIC
jgi:hypothetical protein